MGDLQIALIDDLVVVEEDVEVDDARSPALAFDPLAAHVGLDLLQALEQVGRGELGFYLEDAVAEPGLRVAVRLAFVERGFLYHARLRQLGYTAPGLADVGSPVSKIGSDPDEHAVRHTIRPPHPTSTTAAIPRCPRGHLSRIHHAHPLPRAAFRSQAVADRERLGAASIEICAPLQGAVSRQLSAISSQLCALRRHQSRYGGPPESRKLISAS